jgi:hypothetical protein
MLPLSSDEVATGSFTKLFKAASCRTQGQQMHKAKASLELRVGVFSKSILRLEAMLLKT